MKNKVQTPERSAIAEAFAKALAITPKHIVPTPEPTPAKQGFEVEAAQQFKLGKGDMV